VNATVWQLDRPERPDLGHVSHKGTNPASSLAARRAMDSKGSVYVGESGEAAVQKFAPTP